MESMLQDSHITPGCNRKSEESLWGLPLQRYSGCPFLSHCLCLHLPRLKSQGQSGNFHQEPWANQHVACCDVSMHKPVLWQQVVLRHENHCNLQYLSHCTVLIKHNFHTICLHCHNTRTRPVATCLATTYTDLSEKDCSWWHVPRPPCVLEINQKFFIKKYPFIYCFQFLPLEGSIRNAADFQECSSRKPSTWESVVSGSTAFAPDCRVCKLLSRTAPTPQTLLPRDCLNFLKQTHECQCNGISQIRRSAKYFNHLLNLT